MRAVKPRRSMRELLSSTLPGFRSPWVMLRACRYDRPCRGEGGVQGMDEEIQLSVRPTAAMNAKYETHHNTIVCKLY